MRVVLAVVSALIAWASLGIAYADPPVRNEATVLGHVTIDKDDSSVGYVHARYTCQPSTLAPAHLWVSVKQAEDGSADPALLEEGSGSGNVAATWLQSHPAEVECDGRNHVQVFEVNTLEELPEEFGGGTVGYGELVRGEGYVQFCLITGDETFIFDMQFQTVK